MYSRRRFIIQHSLAGLAAVFVPSRQASAHADTSEMQFVSPVDGDLLHRYDGEMTDSIIRIKVKATAPANRTILVNNVSARYVQGNYVAEITLRNYENEIELTDKGTGAKKSIKVYWAKNLAGKYRLSIDDAIWFLKDLHLNAASYSSLFDNPFLGALKRLHDTYGVKIHINIFYETDGFNISQMTEKFKPEWRSNADWLQLSFHAKAEFPDDPYKHAGYQQVKKECDAVIEQIRRFAGDELVSPVTTLHWGDVPVEVSRALRDAGYTGQLCDFNVGDGLPPCSYYLDMEQRQHMQKRFVWKDNAEGITFIKSSIIIDTKKLDEIVPHLDQYDRQSRKPPYVDLLVHEQYFYSSYHNYQPDYLEKVRTAVEWATAQGYKPAFIRDCINQ